MLKSGLIIGAVGLVLALGGSLITPLCVPCLALFLGLAAGYLSGVFDKPGQNSEALKKGALSGAIASLGTIIGQIIGALINAATVDAAQAAEIMKEFGYAVPGDMESFYAIGQIGGTVCFSFLDIIMMALFGLLGGILWWKMTGEKQSQPTIIEG